MLDRPAFMNERHGFMRTCADLLHCLCQALCLGGLSLIRHRCCIREIAFHELNIPMVKEIGLLGEIQPDKSPGIFSLALNGSSSSGQS